MVAKAVYFILFLIGLASSAPTSKDESSVLTIDEKAFPDSLVVYTSEHDIVQIVVPLNGLNFEDTDVDSTEDDDKITIFFVEADIKENGEKVYKGTYVLEDKTSKKILDNGIAVTADNGKNKDVFFGATDGLYKYDALKKEAEKYGSVTDNIVDLVKLNSTDAIYILTEDYVLYNVTEQGTKKTKIENVNARELVLDSGNNLYFLGEDKKPYVLINGVVKGFENLPSSASYAKLIKPPFIIEEGVVLILDKDVFLIYSNGTTELTDFDIKISKPSAYAAEAALIVYIGYNKKIYEYNILAMLFSEVLEELKESLNEITSFFNDSKDSIKTLASQPVNTQLQSRLIK